MYKSTLFILIYIACIVVNLTLAVEEAYSKGDSTLTYSLQEKYEQYIDQMCLDCCGKHAYTCYFNCLNTYSENCAENPNDPKCEDMMAKFFKEERCPIDKKPKKTYKSTTIFYRPALGPPPCHQNKSPNTINNKTTPTENEQDNQRNNK